MKWDSQPDHSLRVATTDRLYDTGIVSPCCPHGMDMGHGLIMPLSLSLSVSSQDGLIVLIVNNVVLIVLVLVLVRTYEVPECLPYKVILSELLFVPILHVT